MSRALSTRDLPIFIVSMHGKYLWRKAGGYVEIFHSFKCRPNTCRNMIDQNNRLKKVKKVPRSLAGRGSIYTSKNGRKIMIVLTSIL